ncbi:MAG: NAD-dependent epimerase/dehydratase family protein [Candidatus Eisenbacteria bacterium]
MIAITGAAGYVGAQLCTELERQGLEVRRLTRRPDPARGDAPFKLGEPVAATSLSGVHTLIHAAYDFRPPREAELRRLNVDGTRLLFDAARQAGVRRVLFVSSIASFEESRSAYGRAKFTIEQDVKAAGWTSIRPGMVFGSQRGGLFASLDRVVRLLPVLPDLGNRTRLFLVHADDLFRVVQAWLTLVGRPAPALIRAAHPQLFSMRGVLEVLAEAAGRRPVFLPVPTGAGLAVLRAFESIGLTLPFRSDSLMSMLHGNPDPGLSEEVLDVRLRPLNVATLRAEA